MFRRKFGALKALFSGASPCIPKCLLRIQARVGWYGLLAPAFDTTRMLATKEGLFVGMSSGAAVAGALKYARGMKSGTVVVLLADRGDRYLSTKLFMSTCACCPP